MTKLAAVSTALALYACGGGAKPATRIPSPPGKTAAKPAAAAGDLYDRLGGQRAIVAVVDDFIARVGADDRIKLRFANTNLDKLKLLLVEFVCMATGGPCKYTGQDMETSHAGMEVVDEEFTALVEDLSATLDKLNVGAKEKGELLGALGPLKPTIVIGADRLRPVAQDKLAKANAALAKITDKNAAELMRGAIAAAKRGQRNYADQLFSRVELLVGADTVAVAVPAFRSGAPKRIDTPLEQMDKDSKPQPKIVGSSEDDEPVAGKAGAGSLAGKITVDGKPLDGVGLVMLYPMAGKTAKRTAKSRIVEQRNKTFSPRLLAVPPGSTVAFPNFDDVYHNVFSLSSTQPFDLGLFKNGQSRKIKFDKTGLVRLGCNVHAKMASFVFVIDAPHYVPVEGDTQFTFKSLVPGKYKARVWSENSAEPTETEITIAAGPNTIAFDVKADGDTGPSKDKFGNPRQVSAKEAR